MTIQTHIDASLEAERPMRPVATRRSRLSRLATSAVVIYATLIVVLLADPKPVADWLDEFDPNPLVNTARSCVDRIVLVSDALKTTALSASVRAHAKELMQRPDR